jgi:hypothetical protein
MNFFLVETPILVRPNFNKTLDVEWSIKSVGIIMSQKLGRQEVAYANKRLSHI